MPIGPARMPLLDHLGELRRRLTIIVVSVLAATIVMYFATPVIVDILKAPIAPFVPDGKFYVTSSLGGFAIKFGIAIKVAVVMCTPMIIWQILAFFLPALRPNERKWVLHHYPRWLCVAYWRDLWYRHGAARSRGLHQHRDSPHDRFRHFL